MKQLSLFTEPDLLWQDKIRNPQCTLCPLHENADHVCLMGSGSRKATIMIVGEAPGAREDEEHAAFVGPAGRLLTELLAEVGISREDCYITNAAKCRPPGNRTPTRPEAKVCSSTYLAEEIQRSNCTTILSLGNTALQATTGRSGITKYRGKVFRHGDRYVLPTFHPAAALRSPKYLPAIRADFAAFTRLHGGGTTGGGADPTRTKIVRTKAQLAWLCRKIEEADELAFDLETDGLDEWREGNHGIVTAGFSWQEGLGIAVPLNHPESKWDGNSHRILKSISQSLATFASRGGRLVAHNGKFDSRWFAASGVFVRVTFDTMLAAHLLDENSPKALEFLVTTRLGVDSWKLGEEIKNPRGIPLTRLCVYQARDADNTLRLYHLLRKELVEYPRLVRLFMKLKMPASQMLVQVEKGGIYVHGHKLDSVTEQVNANLRKLSAYMDQSSGGINYNSPQQVAPWLFEKLGLEIIERTAKTGNPSTKESVLLKLAMENKMAAALLKYRKWQKYSGYLNNWSERTDSRSRIHPSFLLHGTVTQRLSSRSPNLQQVPRDPLMRSIFGAPSGWVFLEADYSQIELRLIAMLANEITMLQLLNRGLDLHTNTAMNILGATRESITKDQRVVWGKHPNFGLCFGMSAGEEGKEGGYVDYCKENGIYITTAQGEHAYQTFHQTYPRLRPWYARQKRLAHRYGQVTNIFGGIRHLPDIRSSETKVVKEAERQAVNSPVQGPASEMALFSAVRLSNKLPTRDSRIVGLIHDALLFQVRESVALEVAHEIRAEMEDVEPLRRTFGAEITVPIKVDVSIGDSWGSGEEIE